MSWEIKDEWIDLALARHYVIFHNPDVLVPHAKTGKPVPLEYHLINYMKLNSCPTCGRLKAGEQAEPVDFQAVKKHLHAALNAHHNQLMQHREKHKQVRIGNGPKA